MLWVNTRVCYLYVMDTVIDHQHVKRMVEAGFTEDQAEAVASGITDRLATKTDLDLLKADVETMGARLEGKMDKLESKIAWMLLVQSIAVIGLVVALVKL